MKALVLSSSPRRNGDSAILAEAVHAGLTEAGHDATLLFADDFLKTFLGDCRKCRKPDGECAIEDGYRSVFLDQYLPADGFIAATPIYWYGMSAQLKAFYDRTFCYYAASVQVRRRSSRRCKASASALCSAPRRRFPWSRARIISQMQEFTRYTHCTFVGIVHGYGNARGDVRKDPCEPIMAAERFGREFFTRHTSDYQIDTVRSGRVWG